MQTHAEKNTSQLQYKWMYTRKILKFIVYIMRKIP